MQSSFLQSLFLCRRRDTMKIALTMSFAFGVIAIAMCVIYDVGLLLAISVCLPFVISVAFAFWIMGKTEEASSDKRYEKNVLWGKDDDDWDWK